MALVPAVPFFTTIAKAWRRVWLDRRRIVREARAPFLALCLLYGLFEVLDQRAGNPSVIHGLWLVLSAVPGAAFALRCHQLVLLEGAALPSTSQQRAALIWFSLLGAAGSVVSELLGALPSQMAPSIFLGYLLG